MRQRRVTEEEVQAVLESRIQPRADAKGNMIYVAHPNGRRIKVVVDERVRPWAVITVGD
jgi:hypothetical protein